MLGDESLDYVCKGRQAMDELLSPHACRDGSALRERGGGDAIRTNFCIDADRILHNPLYNRSADKTQVFSLYRNDDVTRRAMHVQFVSRIGRTLGRALRLNCDLIEAIAIGHDVGHTPFGHKGEEFLSALYQENTGRFFHHNVHSVRVLQRLTDLNLSLQTLDGILCHNGEKAFDRYTPRPLPTFAQFYDTLEQCYTQKDAMLRLHPCTLEGCVVRISDIIAYVGKDRQDAKKVNLPTLRELNARPRPLGRKNSDMIGTIVADIIDNSVGKDHLSMSGDVFSALKQMTDDNYHYIYQCDEVTRPYRDVIEPMMRRIYEQCVSDLSGNHYKAPIYQHYLNTSVVGNAYRVTGGNRRIDFERHRLHDIVVDYIASMTDDYFVDLFAHMFPGDPLAAGIRYVGYFDKG